MELAVGTGHPREHPRVTDKLVTSVRRGKWLQAAELSLVVKAGERAFGAEGGGPDGSAWATPTAGKITFSYSGGNTGILTGEQHSTGI